MLQNLIHCCSKHPWKSQGFILFFFQPCAQALQKLIEIIPQTEYKGFVTVKKKNKKLLSQYTTGEVERVSGDRVNQVSPVDIS